MKLAACPTVSPSGLELYLLAFSGHRNLAVIRRFVPCECILNDIVARLFCGELLLLVDSFGASSIFRVRVKISAPTT
jgi:hypothetical protein